MYVTELPEINIHNSYVLIDNCESIINNLLKRESLPYMLHVLTVNEVIV